MEWSSANIATWPGLGETQRALLIALKRLGPATQAEVGRELDYAPATLREHLQALAAHALVERRGTRRAKRGRPEVVYALTPQGESLFPRREATVLRELVDYLGRRGHARLLDAFFAARVKARRADAHARVKSLRGTARVAEVARIFSDEGYMAVVGGTPAQPTLRLCHCPIRDLVAVTRTPCRHEQALMADLLGPLERTEYMPDGQHSCSYISTQETT